MFEVYPNHRSQPIYGSKFYQWVVWLEGKPEIFRTISKVQYFLHPTFEREMVETDDKLSQFRIDAMGWGSFYIRVKVYFDKDVSHEISYFLDVDQFFPRKGPPPSSQVAQSYTSEPAVRRSITEMELADLYAAGHRDFSDITIALEKSDGLERKEFVAANFERANLENISMVGSNLSMCNFHAANLSNAKLTGVNFTRTRLTQANLSGAIIYGVNKTDWLVEGVKATHVFLGSDGTRRVPSARDFASEEFSRWLMALKDLDEIVPPNAPKVFMSYSWKDEKSVLAVDQWLRNHGINVLIDRRDFIAGDDIYDAMTETVMTADKMVVFYSKNSRGRPYPKLERRIALQREAQAAQIGWKRAFSIYLQLDDEPLPVEVSHRIAILAKGRGFVEVCAALLDAILEQKRDSPAIDLSQYEERAPWD